MSTTEYFAGLAIRLVVIALAAWNVGTALRFVPGLPRQVARYATAATVYVLTVLCMGPFRP